MKTELYFDKLAGILTKTNAEDIRAIEKLTKGESHERTDFYSQIPLTGA